MDRSGIDELSERLAGQVIVVEPGPDKSDLEKIALGHGATVEQNAVKGRTTKYITVRICYDCTLSPQYKGHQLQGSVVKLLAKTMMLISKILEMVIRH